MMRLGLKTARIAASLALLIAIATSAWNHAGEAGEPSRRTWDFEHDPEGQVPRDISNTVGRWAVVADPKGRVLAQQARSEDDTFNVALFEGDAYRDLELSVRLRAVEGELDQGGGLIWRARDAKNYYIARYNPLEDNFRVYKVQDGKRTQFQSVAIPGDRRWHTIRVTMVGDAITCSFDGTKYLEVRDSTFPGPGKIGLWTKADARSYFDDLTVGAR